MVGSASSRRSSLRAVASTGYNRPGYGGVAQLAERYVRNVEAEGSNPFTSTRQW